MSAESSPDPRLDQARASDEQIQEVHAILRREKPEPTEGYSPLPLVLLGLMSACVLFAAIYIDRYSSGFNPMVYDDRVPAGVQNAAPPVVENPAVVGHRLFLSTCAACHQPTGKGIPGVYPPLAGSDWAQGPEDRVIRIPLKGLMGPITVAGKHFNNVMPEFGSALSDEQIAYILTYVRSAWGNKAPPISPAKVAAVRAAVAGHSGHWTPEELLKVK